jgi:hypothetical protein
LFPDLITNLRTPVFGKLPDLRGHFQVQETLHGIAATLMDTGMAIIYKALFLEKFAIYL